MSHFTVLVIGDNYKKQLAPFQKNNMDDCPKEYLEFNDCTDEVMDDWATGTAKEFYCSSNSSWGFELPNESYEKIKLCNVGDAVDITHRSIGISYFKLNKHYKVYPEYANKKYPEDYHIWIKVEHIYASSSNDPETCFNGSVRVKIIDPPKEITLKEGYNNDFDKYQKEYYGYEKDEDGKYGYWENPNAQWDWYQVGGRWSGFFQLKPALQLEDNQNISKFINDFGFSEGEIMQFINLWKTNKTKFEKIISKYNGKSQAVRDFVKKYCEKSNSTNIAYRKGTLGSGGAFGNSKKDYIGRADQAYKKDIDFDAMRDQERQKAEELWDKVNNTIGHLNLIWSWKSLLKRVEDDSDSLKLDQAREMYHSQTIIQEYKKLDMFFTDIEEFLVSKEEYVNRKVNGAISTFAVVKDGNWYEKGSMGWWGCVSDEKDQDKWNEEFTKLLDDISDDTILTLVDCHI